METPFVSNTHNVRHLLETNYVPSPAEQKSVWDVISAQEEKLSTVSSEIASLKERLIFLETERDSLQESLRLLKGLSSLIRRLPEEILAEIFVFSSISPIPPLPKYGYDQKSREISLDNPPFILFRVCKRWKRIAIQTPRLFTQMILRKGLSEPTINPYAVLPLWLRYSGSLPLEVHFRLPRHFRWKPLQIRLNLPDLFGPLKPELQRITTLVLTTQNSLPVLFPPNTTTDLPLLKELRLLDDIYATERDTIGTVMVGGVTDAEMKLMDHLLRSFRFGKNLVNFKGATEPNGLIQLFLQSPNLESCKIKYTQFSEELPLALRSPIFLPYLSSLELKCSPTNELLSPILPYLRTPTLRDLSIRREDSEGEDFLLPFITSWLEHSEVKLDYLSLALCHLNIWPNDLRALLHLLPTLPHLRLHSGEFTSELLAVLNATINPDILPSLTKLELINSYDLPLFGTIEVLRSRLNNQSNSGNRKLLQKFVGHDVFHWMDNEDVEMDDDEAFEILRSEFPDLEMDLAIVYK